VNLYADTNWNIDNENNSIYSVFETIDQAKWNTFVVCQVSSNDISFNALVPYSEYKEYYTLNPPVKLQYKGYDLVKHDSFFWGKKGSSVMIDIDGVEFGGFTRKNSHQITYTGSQSSQIIKNLKKGNKLKLDKHFWNEEGSKSYPIFSLIGFTKEYSMLNKNKHNKVTKQYPTSGLRCKTQGKRKIVWINTSHGSYALNGPAIDWAKSNKDMGNPILGSDGKPMKIGRDHIPSDKLHSLIYKGLDKCN
jgi:hypothetical protein